MMYDYELVKQALVYMREYEKILADKYNAKVKIVDLSEDHLIGRMNSSVTLSAENDSLLAWLGIWSSRTGEILAFDYAETFQFNEAFEIHATEEILSHLERIIAVFRDLKA